MSQNTLYRVAREIDNNNISIDYHKDSECSEEPVFSQKYKLNAAISIGNMSVKVTKLYNTNETNDATKTYRINHYYNSKKGRGKHNSTVMAVDGIETICPQLMLTFMYAKEKSKNKNEHKDQAEESATSTNATEEQSATTDASAPQEDPEDPEPQEDPVRPRTNGDTP